MYVYCKSQQTPVCVFIVVRLKGRDNHEPWIMLTRQLACISIALTMQWTGLDREVVLTGGFIVWTVSGSQLERIYIEVRATGNASSVSMLTTRSPPCPAGKTDTIRTLRISAGDRLTVSCRKARHHQDTRSLQPFDSSFVPAMLPVWNL